MHYHLSIDEDMPYTDLSMLLTYTIIICVSDMSWCLKLCSHSSKCHVAVSMMGKVPEMKRRVYF